MYEDILPQALAIGIDYRTFMHSTPNLLRSFYKGYKLQRKIKNEEDWLLGKYIYDAFCAVMDQVCSGMAGKKSNAEYPKKPYDIEQKSEELSEEEIQRQRETFVTKLQIMKNNYEINNKDS